MAARASKLVVRPGRQVGHWLMRKAGSSSGLLMGIWPLSWRRRRRSVGCLLVASTSIIQPTDREGVYGSLTWKVLEERLVGSRLANWYSALRVKPLNTYSLPHCAMMVEPWTAGRSIGSSYYLPRTRASAIHCPTR